MLKKRASRLALAGDPIVLASFCLTTHPRGSSDWKEQPCDAFYLIDGGATCAGLQTTKLKVESDTLLLVRRGERRGYWNLYGDSPRIWALYFKAATRIYAQLPALCESIPARRLWRLGRSDADLFRTLFVRIAAENAAAQTTSGMAASSWLQLIMVSVQRWAERRKRPGAQDPVRDTLANLPPEPDPKLWQGAILERPASCSCA